MSFEKKRALWNHCVKFAVYAASVLTASLLLGLIGYILYRGLPNLSWELVSTQTSYLRGTIGILPNLVNTLYIILVAMVIVLPLGVGAAIYLTEYAENRRLVSLIEFAAETLTGIPSIIFGLVGMLFFVQKMNLQAGVLAGGLTLVVMILPTIVSVTVTSLRAVPPEYYEGSLALGATPVTSIFKMNIRAARSGIVTGIVLGVGRAIGETMAIIMVSGNVPNLPNLFKSVRFLTTGIVSEMSYAADLHRQSLFSIGLVLFVFIFFINLLLNRILKKGAKAR